jgi:hemerythrin superfamily protein
MSATGRLLLSDHQRLDKLFEQLRDDVHRGDWTVCQRTWGRFERELLDHLEGEERHLLPIFEREYPDETESLREEHANIRLLLANLGVQLELHALREQHARHFIELLQEHASREEALLYRWAKSLPPEVAKVLAERCAAKPLTAAHDGDRDRSRLA